MGLMEELAGNSPGTNGVRVGLSEGVESLCECLACLHVPKERSSCDLNRGLLMPGLSVVGETLIIHLVGCFGRLVCTHHLQNLGLCSFEACKLSSESFGHKRYEIHRCASDSVGGSC